MDKQIDAPIQPIGSHAMSKVQFLINTIVSSKLMYKVMKLWPCNTVHAECFCDPKEIKFGIQCNGLLSQPYIMPNLHI